MAVSLLVYVPFLLLAAPLPLSVSFRLSNVWTGFFVLMARVLVGIRHEFHGLEHLPQGACVYYSKHQSAWETLAYQTIFPHYVWIIKREALWIPVFGWGLATLRPIAINRSSGQKAVSQIVEQGCRRLREGVGVMIFPEGTRIKPGERHRYGLGGALLAKAAGAQLVPIAHNSGLFWPPRRLGGYQAGVIDVVIGEPLDSRGLDEHEITQRLKCWMDETSDGLISSPRFDPGFGPGFGPEREPGTSDETPESSLS
jgi:1-acyl-sn-glycerol-3-phosphate acyltransferase